MNLEQAIHWRYATKRMTGQKVPDKKFRQILDAIRMAPTSRGLQPFKVFIIEDLNLKKEIQPLADGQNQIVECSHLLVFAVETGISHSRIDEYIMHLSSERNIPALKLEGLRKTLLKDQLPMNREQYYHWASKQAYISMSYGQLMANTMGIDACPMEGFNPNALDELLHLNTKGLRSCLLMAVGYRDEVNDYMFRLKKVRKSDQELFITLGSSV